MFSFFFLPVPPYSVAMALFRFFPLLCFFMWLTFVCAHLLIRSNH